MVDKPMCSMAETCLALRDGGSQQEPKAGKREGAETKELRTCNNRGDRSGRVEGKPGSLKAARVWMKGLPIQQWPSSNSSAGPCLLTCLCLMCVPTVRAYRSGCITARAELAIQVWVDLGQLQRSSLGTSSTKAGVRGHRRPRK